ncbi:copper chaperone PCu(A)C [Pseudomonas protegens]|uniref:copper chaperone PCu(A)C n=1 Tax=Pseudomonas protegens TaxID=380021 RepID=UPI001B315260|nr:copper chaperone PCu(A)C [Pseudomonas protegens]MBP5096943.1 copper chaperone PCu(A)C [Pseudomonas protegens]MBP5122517.1 copper chaperone PCu(A)C [Pseudomonas protegens]QTU07036.1 copper chaperone PCu(A)C [Pseudomonas protegens]QTU13346.1 copper chaperone PCu(A)C [Pseudomonas protegens]QTU39275.1 copper chaperone PCu(A)C [Pseudomonas protegens]
MHSLQRPSRLKAALLLVSLLGLGGTASAATQVDNAWVRATVAGQHASGAFMDLTASSDSKLVEVQSPVAKNVQIHQSSMHNDVMSMQQVDAVALPAGQKVSLDTHGYHVMLMELTGQIKAGDKVPLTLTVENAKGEKETIKVQAQARALNAPDHSMMKH